MSMYRCPMSYLKKHSWNPPFRLAAVDAYEDYARRFESTSEKAWFSRLATHEEGPRRRGGESPQIAKSLDSKQRTPTAPSPTYYHPPIQA